MEKVQLSMVVLFVVGMASLGVGDAYTFKLNWSQPDKTNFNKWSGRNRFQINDTIEFTYDAKEDSVLVVKEEDYNACNTKSPKQSLTGGSNSFKFQTSGPHYFISGNATRCQKGEKLLVRVITPRNRKTSTAPTPAQAPAVAPAVAPAPALAPPTQSPSTSPSPSPSSNVNSTAAPTPAPLPSTQAPSPASSSPSGSVGSPGMGPSASSAPETSSKPPSHSDGAPTAVFSATAVSVTLFVMVLGFWM